MIVFTRPAAHEDIPQITEIINHYIEHSVLTFRLEHVSEASTLEAFKSVREQNLPYLVAVREDAPMTVLGYAYASGYRMPSHKGYRHTVELSVYAHPEHLMHGVGTALMDTLVAVLTNPTDSIEYEYSSPDKSVPVVK